MPKRKKKRAPKKQPAKKAAKPNVQKLKRTPVTARAKNEHGLNAKQQRFVDEYLIDLNAAQAAIRAGYSPRSAAVTSSRLLTKANIKAVVSERRQQLSNKLQISAERVLNEYARIAFSDLYDIVDWGENGVTLRNADQLTPDQRAAVAEVTDHFNIIYDEETGEEIRTVGKRRIKLYDKIRALDALSKHLGLFKDEGGGTTNVMNWMQLVIMAEQAEKKKQIEGKL